MRNPVELIRPSRRSPAQKALSTVAKAVRSAKDAAPDVSVAKAAGAAGIAAVTGIAVGRRDRLRGLLGRDGQQPHLATTPSPGTTTGGIEGTTGGGARVSGDANPVAAPDLASGS